MWHCVYRASYCNVFMTNEMHSSFNQFLFHSFLSALLVSNESSCSSSAARHNILYYTVQSVQSCKRIYLLAAGLACRHSGFRLKSAVTVLGLWMLCRVSFDLSHQRYAELMLSAVITIQKRNVRRGFAPKRKVTKMCLPSHRYWHLTTSLLDKVTIKSLVSQPFSSVTGLITKPSRTQTGVLNYSVTSWKWLKKFHNASGYVDYRCMKSCVLSESLYF